MDQALSLDTIRRRFRLRAAATLLLLGGLCAGAFGLNRVLRPSVSGDDVVIAAELDAGSDVALLRDGAYRGVPGAS